MKIKARQKDLENHTCLNGLLHRDSTVLQAIYTAYFPGICQHITKHGGITEDAEDVFQEALIVIYKKLKANTLQLTSSFYTYLFAVCKMIWLKKLSTKKIKVVAITPIVEATDELPIEEELLQTERYLLYQAKFKLLGAQCQQLLQLFFKGVSMEAIAQEMGFASVGYAKKRKFTCKEQLITLIKADERFQELL